MNIVSLFSGCGGLDLGFKKAGFKVIWANENDASIWETYEKNHPETFLDRRSIAKIHSSEIPEAIGVIGGPPCQSWSAGGAQRGLNDKRGKLFLEYVRVISEKNPYFFVAENVPGILAPKHKKSIDLITDLFESAGNYGYNVTIHQVNASDYGVPQDRKRVIFIGFRKDLGTYFEMPRKQEPRRDASVLYDLRNSAKASIDNRPNITPLSTANHEYLTGSFSYIFMSRNRVLSWNKPSFTIQASARHVSLHPDCPPMVRVEKDVMKFSGPLDSYRRLTVRECARLQTFPDEFVFHYTHLNHGYKMVGNAVPVNLAAAIGRKIMQDLVSMKIIDSQSNLRNEEVRLEQ